TKILDRKCFDLGGIKMLYSSSFLSEAEFDQLYNGAGYKALKAKYDAAGNAQTLYKKVVMAARCRQPVERGTGLSRFASRASSQRPFSRLSTESVWPARSIGAPPDGVTTIDNRVHMNAKSPWI